jgi:hypothetical protein
MCPSSEFVTVQPRQTSRVLMSEGEGENSFWKKKQVLVWEEEKFLPRTNQISHKNKQWLLAGEFSEFEYSRETRRFWRVRVLAKTCQTRRHSPNAIFEKNVTRLATFARVIRHSREFGASGHCLHKMFVFETFLPIQYNWNKWWLKWNLSNVLFPIY